MIKYIKLILGENFVFYHLFPESLLVVASRYYLPATFFSSMLTVTAGNLIISVDYLFL